MSRGFVPDPHPEQNKFRSTVTVSSPVWYLEQEGEMSKDQQGVRGSGAGRTVMIVEEDADHSGLLRQLLENEGYKVLETSNLDAFRTAVELRPEVIVLDLMMPIIDGFVLAEVFKACRLTRHIPIIFLTALHETQYEEASRQLQAAAYLTKPVTIANFLFTINAVLQAGPAKASG